MEVEISQETKNLTDCKKGFSCLNQETRDICKIGYCVEEMYYFIEDRDIDCNFRFNYGYATMCRCPTRKELYSKYGI